MFIGTCYTRVKKEFEKLPLLTDALQKCQNHSQITKNLPLVLTEKILKVNPSNTNRETEGERPRKESHSQQK